MAGVDQKPKIPMDTVHQWLQEHYSLAGSFEPLPGERDLNFKLSTEGGETFVCKICNSSEDLEFLSAQNEVMAYLNRRDLSAIPDVLTSSQAKTLVTVQADDGRFYVLRVLTYIPGQTLVKCAPYSFELIRDFGYTMGRLTRALVGFDHPAFHYDFYWDLAKSGAMVEKYRDLISDPRLRENVDRIYQDFKTIVEPRLDKLSKSVIHNDANDHNILAEADKVTGIIDFGDMVYSCTICDLAIATAYAVLEADDILRVITEMTVGYSEAMPIEDEELTVLFPMMRMRLCVSACIAAHQMSLRPDDAYLAISQEPIRKTLPKLLVLEADAVEDLSKKVLS